MLVEENMGKMKILLALAAWSTSAAAANCSWADDNNHFDLSGLQRGEAQGDYMSRDNSGRIFVLNVCGPLTTSSGNCPNKGATVCETDLKDHSKDAMLASAVDVPAPVWYTLSTLEHLSDIHDDFRFLSGR